MLGKVGRQTTFSSLAQRCGNWTLWAGRRLRTAAWRVGVPSASQALVLMGLMRRDETFIVGTPLRCHFQKKNVAVLAVTKE